MYVIKRIIFIVSLLIFIQFTGCNSHIYRSDFDSPITFYDKVNELCFQQEVNVFTYNGNKYIGNDFTISESTSSFLDKITSCEKIILTENIHYISFKSYSGNLTKSAVGGAIAGVGSGLLLSQFAKRAEIPAIIYVPVTGIVGTVIGVAVGVIYGNEIIIQIN